jgi:hypothetical protein
MSVSSHAIPFSLIHRGLFGDSEMYLSFFNECTTRAILSQLAMLVSRDEIISAALEWVP